MTVKTQKLDDGSIEPIPTKKTPETMEELFKNWNGKYDSYPMMKELDNIKSKGNELW